MSRIGKHKSDQQPSKKKGSWLQRVKTALTDGYDKLARRSAGGVHNWTTVREHDNISPTTRVRSSSEVWENRRNSILRLMVQPSTSYMSNRETNPIARRQKQADSVRTLAESRCHALSPIEETQLCEFVRTGKPYKGWLASTPPILVFLKDEPPSESS